MGLLETVRAKLEIYRLEQRYTKREKRTTFYSGAQYIDGEYHYNTTPSSPSSKNSAASSNNNSFGGSFGRSGKRMSSMINISEVFSPSAKTGGGGKRVSAGA